MVLPRCVCGRRRPNSQNSCPCGCNEAQGGKNTPWNPQIKSLILGDLDAIGCVKITASSGRRNWVCVTSQCNINISSVRLERDISVLKKIHGLSRYRISICRKNNEPGRSGSGGNINGPFIRGRNVGGLCFDVAHGFFRFQKLKNLWGTRSVYCPQKFVNKSSRPTKSILMSTVDAPRVAP